QPSPSKQPSGARGTVSGQRDRSSARFGANRGDLRPRWLPRRLCRGDRASRRGRGRLAVGRRRVVIDALRQFRSFDRGVRVLLVNQFAINAGFFMLMPYLALYLSGRLALTAW